MPVDSLLCSVILLRICLSRSVYNFTLTRKYERNFSHSYLVARLCFGYSWIRQNAHTVSTILSVAQLLNVLFTEP